jgi:extracellular elastinolytic metalloproteinase
LILTGICILCSCSRFQAVIDAERGQVHSLLNWVSHASYAVFPLGAMNPKKGTRKLMKDSLSKMASPLGWHSDGTMNYTTTQGNNVIAQENLGNFIILTLEGSYKWKNNHRPSSNRLCFEFPIDFSQYPEQYIDASITNLFYWSNVLHDLFYAYGFTEEAGNFQQYNFGKGGKENDAVIANAQDGSGFNNAYFATPPDGQHGRMKMFVWDSSEPWRDGDLEAAIIIHEYSHGVSNRLTGGPDNVGCLGWGESGGMGEGWGDFLAILLQMDAHTKPTDAFGMAEYSNAGKTIRKFMYSTSMKVNPLTYASIREKRFFGSHAMGEIWAEMLFEVYWYLVPKFGFDSDWFNLPNSSFLSRGPPGNIVMMQLIIDGMKLQPCFPSFVDGRDAIIQADIILYGGIHVCDLWKGFAKRGLGIGAKKGGFESFQVPFNCH